MDKALAKNNITMHMHGHFAPGAVIAFPPHWVPSKHNYIYYDIIILIHLVRFVYL